MENRSNAIHLVGLIHIRNDVGPICQGGIWSALRNDSYKDARQILDNASVDWLLHPSVTSERFDEHIRTVQPDIWSSQCELLLSASRNFRMGRKNSEQSSQGNHENESILWHTRRAV